MQLNSLRPCLSIVMLRPIPPLSYLLYINPWFVPFLSSENLRIWPSTKRLSWAFLLEATYDTFLQNQKRLQSISGFVVDVKI